MSVATQHLPSMFPFTMLHVDTAHNTDESSTSSTIPTDSALKSNISLQSQSPRRRVHFADEVTYHQAPPPTTNNNTPKPELWYSTAEYQFMRQSTVRQAQQVIDLESRNRAPHSYQRVWERVYASSCAKRPIPPSEYVHVQRWLTTIPARLGLERWCIRQLSQDKARRRKAIAEHVRSAHASGGDVRLASTQFSHASTTFAQAAAHALELSLQTENSRARV